MDKFEEVKKIYLNEILDKKKVNLEQRFELTNLFKAIKDEEHLKAFYNGLLENLENKSEKFTRSYVQLMNDEFNKAIGGEK